MKGGYPLRIDFHTHVFPDKLAEKALTSISEHTGAPYFTNGTVADTDEKLKEWNVDSSVALHIATNPKQQYNVKKILGQPRIQNRKTFLLWLHTSGRTGRFIRAGTNQNFGTVRR